MEKFKRIAVVGTLLLIIILGTNRVVSAFSPGFGMNHHDIRPHSSENREQHINEMVEDDIISEEQANDMYDRMERHQKPCHSYSSTRDINNHQPSSESRHQMHTSMMMDGKR
ncbi:hypothetical protein [Isobaculum melis]|uniref:Uncharacterized protein n=1 Tax=Isobaculum melis TaxID=142588 RepID=A0A1H9PY06_9LACT|nr:hypothetical protein [Isobaculum melis]SER53186.1 hypothetical protein SAMN04488559_101231 [Isobaculum melis]